MSLFRRKKDKDKSVKAAGKELVELEKEVFEDWEPKPSKKLTPTPAQEKKMQTEWAAEMLDLDDEELKELVKTKFDELRQWWKDWNGSAQSEEQMSELGIKIKQFIAQE